MLTPFKQVKVTGNFSVLLKKSKQGALEVSGGLNPDKIISRVDKDTLYIYAADNYNEAGDITIQYKELTALTTEKVNSVKSDETLDNKNFSLTAVDSKSINLGFNATSLHISLKGSGNHIFSGKTNNLFLSLSGEGFADALQLNCVSSAVNVDGPGKIHLDPGQSFTAMVSGDGEIGYEREPKHAIVTSGWSQIRKLK